ncbi:MAG: DUF4340 domain-containing protein [Fimbriiglobus sp.]
MNVRLTGILFAVTLALLVGLLALVLNETSGPGTEEFLLAEVSAFPEKEIDTVELSRRADANSPEQKLVISRKDENWVLTAPLASKVDSGQVTAIVRELLKAKPTKYNDLTTNLITHGLDQPLYRVTLKRGDKASGLNIGLTTMGARPVTFVTTQTKPDLPLAVLKTDIAAIFRDSATMKSGDGFTTGKWLGDLRIRRPLGSDLRDATMEARELKLSYGPQQLAFERPDKASWKFSNPANFGDAEEAGDSAAQMPTAPFTGIRPLLASLTSMQLMTPEDYIEKPADLATYQLKDGDPNAIRIELKTVFGTDIVTLGKPVEKDGKPVMPAKVYAKLDGDPGVLQLSFDRLEAVKATFKSPGELRNKDMLSESDRARADAIDITIGTNTLKLRKATVTGESGNSWLIYGGPKPVFAKPGEVEALLASLSKPRVAKEVLSAPYDAVFTGAEKKGTLLVWREGAKDSPTIKLEPGQLPPEPTLKGTPLEFVLGKLEGDYSFVRRTIDGKTADVKVPAGIFAQLSRPRGEWIDPKWKSFVTTDVTRITFNRVSELMDFERRGEVWYAIKPDSLKDRPVDTVAVNALIGKLSTISPEQVISEAPTPDDLKKLSLDPAAPRTRVTLAMKNTTEAQRIYDLGNDTEDRKSVVAKQSASPMVVRLNRSILDAVNNDDIRDRVLYVLDKPNIRTFTVKGWKTPQGPPVTIAFEKTANGWVSKNPASGDPDPAKLDQLLTVLCGPRVEQYVGMPKPEFELSADVNPNCIEILMDYLHLHIRFDIGKTLPDGKSYVFSSTCMKEVGTMDVTLFRKLLEKPTSLQK